MVRTSRHGSPIHDKRPLILHALSSTRIGDKVPDGNTIWDFKEALKTNKVDKKLFDTFNKLLEEKGIITHKCSIIDATFTTVPKRHTTKNDDAHLKKGEELEDLPATCTTRIEKGEIKSQDNVMAQVDVAAR
jgi:hypothetical protein